jgi:hypothetical protein
MLSCLLICRLHKDVHLGQEAGDYGEKIWDIRRPGQITDDNLAAGVSHEVHRRNVSLLSAGARQVVGST